MYGRLTTIATRLFLGTVITQRHAENSDESSAPRRPFKNLFHVVVQLLVNVGVEKNKGGAGSLHFLLLATKCFSTKCRQQKLQLQQQVGVRPSTIFHAGHG